MTALWIYLSITLAIALWLGLVMWRRLDEFDWRYRSGDIWLGFTMAVLLWPVFLVIKPPLILKGKAVMEGDVTNALDLSGGVTGRMRALQRVIDSPSPCGSTVVYRSEDSLLPDQRCLDIRFKAADIEQHFKGDKLPLFLVAEQRALVHFIKDRDEARTDEVEIPDAIDFSTIAFILLENGYGEVDCPLCGATYPAEDLTVDSPPRHPGWNFNTYICPNGHNLVSRRAVHIMARRD